MKVGDLVRFKGHSCSPFGVILRFKYLPESPDDVCDAAYIEWACKYTAPGTYQLSILEVANEVS